MKNSYFIMYILLYVVIKNMKSLIEISKVIIIPYKFLEKKTKDDIIYNRIKE